MPDYGSTMEVLHLAPHLLGFYDGRIPGVRLYSEKPNWLDDGAFALGICTYAVVDGAEALVYDPHISLPHARIIRRTLEEMGVTHMRLVLSHWHDDHVAGTEVFADCEIIANQDTAEILAAHKDALESGDPPITPLILPNSLFSGTLDLMVGQIPVQLRQLDIHSRDGTVALLPGGVLLAGDTLEDPITYVAEEDRLAIHLRDLDRMAEWDISTILPNHGSKAQILAGGYPPAFIAATRLYVEKLLRLEREPALAAQDLPTFAAEALATGAVAYFEPYEAVHRHNVEKVLGVAGQAA
ncbi:MBL fold metallo-hydrolase [Roseixanthobacter glucoisosaccharinicivorans]|uniref:MBL fold metallo-hydrolase n=1 Tax=Roseixanthobacter glucoisosaccharinicivorans TaxID=3119923 RepID=UPI00372C0C33